MMRLVRSRLSAGLKNPSQSFATMQHFTGNNEQRDFGKPVVSWCGTHHVTHLPNGRPLYAARFRAVMSLHGIGGDVLVAAAATEKDAFHINDKGEPLYGGTFKTTFGFYANLAAVCDYNDQWFHITPRGQPAYQGRWAWAGNFTPVSNAVRAVAPVRASVGEYYHIDADGSTIGGPYAYCGDFNTHGEAIVWSFTGKPSYITISNDIVLPYTDGTSNYLDALVPHKGIAMVKDAGGWFFVDRLGKEIAYRPGLRFAMVEPHYNGQAMVRLLNRNRAIVDDQCRIITEFQKSESELDSELNALLPSGLWHLLALKLALECNLLQNLQIDSRIDSKAMDPKMRELILLVCAEMGLCEETISSHKLGGNSLQFVLTAKGHRLFQNDNIISDRCKYWLQDRYLRAWLPAMRNSLNNATQTDAFSELASEGSAAVSLCHRVKALYAQQDWSGIGKHLPLDNKNVIADLGGGTGTLLAEIAGSLPSKDAELLCFDRPEVVALAGDAISSNTPQIKFLEGDLFSGQLPVADMYILSRVLHDWDDSQSLKILQNLHKASGDDSTVCVIDRIASVDNRHASLSLHMYLLQGAHERTETEWDRLFSQAGWKVHDQSTHNDHMVFTLRKVHAINAADQLRISKAIIPIAGLGTRMRPQTLSTPKALLPFVSKSTSSEDVVQPAIFFTLRQLLLEVERICVVASPQQFPSLVPFLASLQVDENDQLTSQCTGQLPSAAMQQDPPQLQETHGQRFFLNDKIQLVAQNDALGFGDAILQAQEFVGGEPFLVALGDHLFTEDCLRQLVESWHELVANGHDMSQSGLTGVCFCKDEDVSSTGILRISQLNDESRLGDVVEMLEKPTLEEAARFQQSHRHYLCQLGLDILPPTIFAELHTVQQQLRHTGDELNLRTAMQRLQRRGHLLACKVDGNRLDFGTPDSYRNSFLAVLQDSTFQQHVPASAALSQNSAPFCDGDGEALIQWLQHHQQHLPCIVSKELFEKGRGKHSLAIASAPGRIDLMGGFADYSGSGVLQFPSSKRTYAVVVLTDEPTVELISLHVPMVSAIFESVQEAPSNIWRKSFPVSTLYEQSSGIVSEAGLRQSLLNIQENSSAVEPSTWPLYVLGAARAGLSTDNMFPSQGLAIVIVSDIPTNVGMASSAAVEMAVAHATRSLITTGVLDESELSELALLCQSAENHVAGAPCGFMDQMTCAHAKENALLSFQCQLPMKLPMTQLQIPRNFKLVGLTSGVKHAVSDSPYERVRTAVSMGKSIINQRISNGRGGDTTTIVNQMCDIQLSDFNRSFRELLPKAMSGAEFLAQYGPLPESECTEVHPDWTYPVQAATAHPVEEHWRVGLFRSTLPSYSLLPNFPTPASEARLHALENQLGELMAQSHQSYSDCGLGANETDMLVELVRAERDHDLIGAKITGGGSGGTVAVLARQNKASDEAIQRVRERYTQQTSNPCLLLSGSSGRTSLHALTQRRMASSARSSSSKKLRVLLANHGYPPEFNGGSEVYTQTLAIQLLKSGHCESVDVFAREHDAFRPDFAVRSRPDTIEPELTVQLINHAREAPYTRFSSEPIDEKFREVCREIKPDIVHFGHLNHLSLNLPKVAKEEGAKTIYTLHDFWLMCPRGQFLETGVTAGEPWQACKGQEDKKCAQRCYIGRFATGLASTQHAKDESEYWTSWIKDRMETVRNVTLPAIDAFVAPSVHLMNRFQEQFQALPEDKTFLFPYGYDRDRLAGRDRQSSRITRSEFVFCYIGRHQPSKGLHLLVEATIQLVKQQPSLIGKFRVYIYGREDASSTPSLKRMLRECILAECEQSIVEFRPEYANENIVKSVFDKVDAIVVASIWDENSPLVIHEAQQCNVPVITSDHGGMAELVQHGVNGLTFRHRDASSLADSMRFAIEEPDQMESFGRRGYLHSIDGQVPTVQNHANEIFSLYQRLSEGNSMQLVRSQGEYDGLLKLASPVAKAPEPIEALTAPWRITFDTNLDDCNFSCTMCEQHSPHSPHQANRKKQGIRRRRMDFKQIEKTVAELAPKGLKEIIPTTMGEPLMYREILSFIELCHKHKVKMNLTTNGSFYRLPNGPPDVEGWAKLIVPVTSDVKFSWNGATAETQEKIMKGSTLSKSIANLTTFIRVRDELAAEAVASSCDGEEPHRCSVTLQMTFMEVNLREIPDVVRLAIEHGVDRVKGHHLWAHFKEIKDQDLRRTEDSIERWNAIATECRAIALSSAPHPGTGKRIRLENFQDLPLSASATSNDGSDGSSPSPIHPEAVCPFLGREAWLNHAGRFDPCCAPDIDRSLFLGQFGSISDSTQLLDLWQSEKYKKLLNEYHNNPLCKGCNMRRPP